MLAQRLCEKDPTKIGQWDSETIPSQVISGGETSSDEGEPIPQHAWKWQTRICLDRIMCQLQTKIENPLFALGVLSLIDGSTSTTRKNAKTNLRFP